VTPPPDAGATTPDRLDIPFADPLVERLFPPLATGVEWGIERTRAALADLGDPHARYPTVHVGGTNGKGSVASTIHAVLEAEGLRSGLYTSPHLCVFPERYVIGGGPVEEERLVAAADAIRPVVLERGLTFFEAITVLAFHLFAEMEADVVVVEVGLGGRLDATNVIRPVCAAITNVAMDHAEYLGETREAVAREKAGIIKPGVPVITAEADPTLVGIFREVAAARGAPITALDPERDLHDVEVDRHHTAFTWRSRTWGSLRLETPLVGRHQAVNAALAVEALEHLPEAMRPDAAAVRRGVAAVRWPGRDQVETIGGGTWIFDVAHNVAGMESLVDTLDRLDLPRPRIALVGVLGDKDWRSMLPPLLERCASAVFTVPPTAPAGRTWDPAEAASAVRLPAGEPPCPRAHGPRRARGRWS
jgi:dihydrofolate synthase/folylpolyglutamate synthase